MGEETAEEAGRGRERRVEARTLLQAALAAAQITLLQVTTGRMKVRAALLAAWHSFRPGTPPPHTHT